MESFIMKKLLILALLLLIPACAAFDPMPEPIDLDYTNLGRIYLATKDLRIINRADKTPLWPPYIGHKFAPTLIDAVYRMAGDRFQAVGKKGHAKLIIKDVNVIEQPIETSSNWDTIFTRQHTSKYIGRVEVSLEAQSSRGAINIATAHAVHSVTLPEDPSNAEKYNAYTKLMHNLMADLNKHLEIAVRRHMKRFLVKNAPTFEQPARTVNAP